MNDQELKLRLYKAFELDWTSQFFISNPRDIEFSEEDKMCCREYALRLTDIVLRELKVK